MSQCIIEETEEDQCIPCYANTNLKEISSKCLTSLKTETFQDQLLNCKFENYTDKFEPQLIRANYNNWLYAMNHKGKLTTTCNDSVIIEELPSTGIITFPDESDCDFTITNGPFNHVSQILPILKVKLETEIADVTAIIPTEEILYWYSSTINHIKNNIVYYGIGFAIMTILICVCTVCISIFTIITYRRNSIQRQRQSRPPRLVRQNRSRNERHRNSTAQQALLEIQDETSMTIRPNTRTNHATNNRTNCTYIIPKLA